MYNEFKKKEYFFFCFNLAQQNLQENSNGEASQCIPWTSDEIDRMVKARLDLPVVEKLRQEGYSMAIIR